MEAAESLVCQRPRFTPYPQKKGLTDESANPLKKTNWRPQRNSSFTRIVLSASKGMEIIVNSILPAVIETP